MSITIPTMLDTPNNTIPAVKVDKVAYEVDANGQISKSAKDKFSDHDTSIGNLNTNVAQHTTNINTLTSNLQTANTTISQHSAKIGDLTGAGLTETDLASAIKNDRSQLSKNVYKSLNDTKQVSVPYNYTGAVVTFLDDDCKANFFNIWKPVCEAKGIKVTLAIVPDWIINQTNEAMTLEQLKSLKDEGYDFVSHTYSHDAAVFKGAVVDLTAVTDDVIENEYKQSQEWLIENGFVGCDTVVYPWGAFDNYYSGQSIRYKRLARKYYKQAVNAVGSMNNSPNDNMYLDRIFLNMSNDITIPKTSVDSALTNNSWLIFGTHSNTTDISSDYLTQLVDYIQSKNIPILTFNEALKYKGNSISSGEFTDTINRCFISPTKNIIDNADINIIRYLAPNNGYAFDSPITVYPYNKLSITKIRATIDTLTSQGGILKTWRFDDVNEFNMQEFDSLNNKVYRRVWNNTNSTWGSWLPINTFEIIPGLAPDNGYTLNSLITAFPTNCMSIMQLKTASDTITGEGGIIKTFYSADYFKMQEYTSLTSATKMIRYWNEGTQAWGNWIILDKNKVGTVTVTQSTWVQSTDYLNIVKQDGYTITGNICLVNGNKNGVFSQGLDMVHFTGVDLPSFKVVGTGSYFTASGVVGQCSFEVSNSSGTGIIAMQGTYSTADLRFLFFNFSYTI